MRSFLATREPHVPHWSWQIETPVAVKMDPVEFAKVEKRLKAAAKRRAAHR